MAAASVLLISSEPKIARAFRRMAKESGVELLVVGSLSEASKNFARRSFDVFFVQIDSPDGEVHRCLANGFAFPDRPPAIVFGSEGRIRDAVDAVRAGAFQYSVKPPADARALARAIRRARTNTRPRERNPVVRAAFVNAFDGFVTADQRLLAVCETVARVAPSQVPLLIVGEDGTGKSLLARMVHMSSPRRFAPLIEFCCAPWPEQVVEAELFGSTANGRPVGSAAGGGRFNLADGGTLVLDDVEGLPPGLRRRVLETALTGRVSSPAGTGHRAADVRLILTLRAPMLRGEGGNRAGESPLEGFPAVRVQIPALRRRVGDIPLLADHFLREFRRKHERRARRFSREALDRLVRYQWPGNVTELRNAIEHAVVLARAETITASALPEMVAEGGKLSRGPGVRPSPLPLKDALREPERRYILRTLNALGWNKQHVAKKLQISRSTLYKKMKELGLDGEEVMSGQEDRH